MSNIRTCLMNPYYKLYVYFLGPKILTEIETLKAKLKKVREPFKNVLAEFVH